MSHTLCCKKLNSRYCSDLRLCQRQEQLLRQQSGQDGVPSALFSFSYMPAVTLKWKRTDNVDLDQVFKVEVELSQNIFQRLDHANNSKKSLLRIIFRKITNRTGMGGLKSKGLKHIAYSLLKDHIEGASKRKVNKKINKV